MDSAMLCEGATVCEFPKPVHPRITHHTLMNISETQMSRVSNLGNTLLDVSLAFPALRFHHSGEEPGRERKFSPTKSTIGLLCPCLMKGAGTLMEL